MVHIHLILIIGLWLVFMQYMATFFQFMLTNRRLEIFSFLHMKTRSLKQCKSFF